MLASRAVGKCRCTAMDERLSMPARINTKVVIPLIVILAVLAGGVIGLAWYTVRRSPEYYQRKGDAAAATSDWRTAEEFYSKAVFQDQGNIELLDTWREAILKIVPADAIEAEKYWRDAQGVLKKKTESRPFEPQYHIDWLSHILELVMPDISSGNATYLADQANLMIEGKPSSDDNPLWEQAYRFRGIANAHRVRETGLDPQIRAQAMEDLNHWLAQQPDDAVATAAKMKWHAFSAESMASGSKPREALAEVDQAESIGTEYLKAHPNSVLVATTLVETLEVRRSIERRLPEGPSDAAARQQELLATAERMALDQSDLPPWMSRRLAMVIDGLSDDRTQAAPRALKVLEHALESKPENPSLRFERARYLARCGESEQSQAAYEAIIESPNLPVSYPSVKLFELRPAAVSEMFDLDFEAWARTSPKDAAASQQARDQVKARLNQYRSMVSDTDPQLLFMDGCVALTDGKAEVAANRFNQFLSTVGDNEITTNKRISTLLLLASSLRQSNQIGAAYGYLAQADQLAGSVSPRIIRGLIETDLASRNFDRAERNLNRLVALDPDSPATTDLRNSLAIARDGAGAGVVDNEVLAAIVEANGLLAKKEVDQARSMLLSARQKYPENIALIFNMVRLEQSQGNTEKAIEYADEALAINPKSEELRILRVMLAGGDLKAAISEVIEDRAGLSEFERHMAKAMAYAKRGFAAEANAEFDAAKAINPDAPAIIERDFGLAFQQNDLSAMLKVVRHAQETNADLAKGLTYRGRYELASGDVAAAIATLLQASNLKPYDGAVWRFLGIAYREAGNYTGAIDAFGKALDREPDNVATLKELATLQVQREEYTKALESIRKAQAYAPSDVEIQNRLLELEGMHGNRARAIEIRESMRDSGGGVENSLLLAQLYELDGKYDEAREVLDSVTPADERERLLLAQSRALWHQRQNQAQEARDALLGFIESTPPPSNEMMIQAMLALMGHYVETGQTDEAIKTAERAVQYQDPIRREADLNLAALYEKQGRMEDAVKKYEEAFVSGEETPHLGLLLIDLHLALAGPTETQDPAGAARHRARAAELLDEIEKENGTSVEALLLRGQLLVQNREIDAAERLFNDAVARYPQDSRVYTARAQFNLACIIESADVGRANRVRADVDQAMELSPNDHKPLLTLVDLARARRDPATGAFSPDYDTMIATWRRILEIDPNQDEVRAEMIETAFSRGQNSQARMLLQQAMDLQPDRAAWFTIRGDLERKTGERPEVYTPFYLQAFEKQPSADRLAKLSQGFLLYNPPRASEVIALYAEWGAGVGDDPTHRLILARAQAAEKNWPAALEGLREAAQVTLRVTDENRRDFLIQDWYQTLPVVAAPDQYISLSEECFGSFDDPWPQGLLGNALYIASTQPQTADPEGLRQAGIERLEAARRRIVAMAPSQRKTRLQQEVGWSLAGAHHSAGEPAKAVEVWRWVLESAPDHFGTLNNLAFVLANDLNDPVAALEPAKRAYEADPADPTVLDTYGYVLFRNNRLDDAERVLRDSLDRLEQAAARMHLGQVLAAKGSVEAARRELTRARSLSEQQGNAARVKEIDEILKTL